MKQAIKQFLKPSWKKIAITIILALPSLGVALSMACISLKLDFNFCDSIDFLFLPYYLIILPIHWSLYLLELLLELLEIPYYQYFFTNSVLIFVIIFFIINSIYWYLFLSFIAWICQVTKNKPLIKKIIRIIGGLLIILLVIRYDLFLLPRIGYLVMEPTTFSYHPLLVPIFLLESVILLTSPLVFISGILLLLQQVKWAWRLFLIALILGLLFLLYLIFKFFNLGEIL